METLLIRLLPEDSDTAEWIVCADRKSPADAARGPLNEAAKLGVRRRVVVLVPSEDVLLTRVNLQTRNRQQFAKAVPYALEDELAQDVEQLHFALGPRQADNSRPVAVCARARMDAWLEGLRAADITPHALLPDVFALPAGDTWNALLEDERAVVRIGAYHGWACDPAQLTDLLALAIEEAQTPPASLTLYLCGHGGVQLDTLGLALNPMRRCPPALFAEGLDEKAGINLLQGTYSSQDDIGHYLKPLRMTAVLAAIWLALQFVIMIGEYRDLARQDRKLITAIEQVYRDTFPNAQRIINPRVQMEQRLAALRGNSADGADTGFLRLVAASGGAAGAISGVQIESLDYGDDRLDLILTATDLQSLEKIKQSLQQAGLAARIESADTRGSTVNARLSIHESNAGEPAE